VHGNAEFAMALYHQLRTMKGNLFFSPYSISTALGMTYAGARGNTEAQMAQAVHFLLNQEQLHAAFALLDAKLNDMGSKGYFQLKVANSLWPQKGYIIQKDFLALVQQFYGVLITSVNYGDPETARCIINAWVMEKTEGKIEELIPPGMLDVWTRLTLVNAIYFKGSWAHQFDQNLTRESPFWITPEEQVQVIMMTQKRAFRYGGVDGLQILELPYTGGTASMFVLLPDEPGGLEDLERLLSVENLSRWTSALDEVEVEVFIPRFEIIFPLRLDETLQSMGMTDAFYSRADFSGISDVEKFFIGSVLHEAFVVVDEEGTEAAAATATVMRSFGLPGELPVFLANHPFVFLVRENSTGCILFIGRVVNPA
jgi:serpin B